MTDEQQTLFDDEAIAAEERALFGDQIRPTRARFDAQGDFLHGTLVEVQRNVDLKTGFEPVDIYVIEGISGVLANHTERVRKGVQYAVAAMHATLKNRLNEADPALGERTAIRRDRDFVSNQEGPSFGRTLVAWQVSMPDRPQTEPEKATGTRKAAK